MSEGERIPREQATPLVSAMVALLTEHCDWIAPAGSYRREKPEIGDVELVAISKPTLLAHMDELVRNGTIAKKEYVNEKTGKVSYRWGEKWRALTFSHGGVTVKFDLFLCDVDNRGNQYELRTGPGDKNTWMMMAFKRFHAPFSVKDGYIWDGEQKLHIPDEQAYFALLGIPYIEPKDRTIEAYQRLIKWGHKWGDVMQFIPTPKRENNPEKPKNNPYWHEWTEERKTAQPSPNKPKREKSQWNWTKPFLCDDGMVWVHIGYGKWAKKSQDDSQTRAYLESYRLNPRSREARASDLMFYLHELERQEKLTTVVQNCLNILRGVA